MLTQENFFRYLEFGSISFQLWGVFFVLAYILVFWLSQQELRRRNISSELMLDLALVILFGGLVGARLWFVVEQGWLRYFELNWDFFIKLIDISTGGISIFGGIFGAILFVAVYIFTGASLKLSKIRVLELADIIFLNVPLGLAIGRVGSFFRDANAGLRVESSLPYLLQYEGGFARHPVALYMALSAFVFFVLLNIVRLYVYKNIIKHPGLISEIFFLWFFGNRFIFDFYRATEPWLSYPRLGSWTYIQWISLVGVMIFATLLVVHILLIKGKLALTKKKLDVYR
jgi:phosphatidylglycerol:prolipoprotein diacylglycerol transferase